MATLSAYASDSVTVAATSELIGIARRAAAGRLQTGTGGNISIRVAGRNEVVIKPSGVGFAECDHDNLLVVDLDGNILKGDAKPSKDMAFHLGIYRVRDDVGGIVHVHSPWATGWAASGRARAADGALRQAEAHPIVPTGPGGGAQRPEDIVAEFRSPGAAALLAEHGSVGVGKTLLAALHVAELIEETAQVAALARLRQGRRRRRSAALRGAPGGLGVRARDRPRHLRRPGAGGRPRRRDRRPGLRAAAGARSRRRRRPRAGCESLVAGRRVRRARSARPPVGRGRPAAGSAPPASTRPRARSCRSTRAAPRSARASCTTTAAPARRPRPQRRRPRTRRRRRGCNASYASAKILWLREHAPAIGIAARRALYQT